MCRFIYLLRGLTDMLPFILGFLFGEYGLVSGQKVIRFVKFNFCCSFEESLGRLPASKLFYPFEGACRLNKPQLILLMASYGVYHFPLLSIHIQHPYSNMDSVIYVGVGDY